MKRVVWGVLLLVLLPLGAHAMDAEQKGRFERILAMNTEELTLDAERVLNEKYPGQDWSHYNFPDFIHDGQAVEVAYKVAVVSEDLLGKTGPHVTDQGLPCNCFCETRGHQSLLSCFLEGGGAERSYSSHAAECHICVSQALSAFLWHDSGASREDILHGLKIKFVRTLPEPDNSSSLDIQKKGEMIGVPHGLNNRGLEKSGMDFSEDAYMP